MTASDALESALVSLKANRQEKANSVAVEMAAGKTESAVQIAREVASLQIDIESIERAIPQIRVTEPSVYEERGMLDL